MPRNDANFFGAKFAKLEADIRGLKSGRLGNSSVHGTRVPFYDNDGDLEMVLGNQGDGSYGARVTKSPEQPTPTAPMLVAGERGDVGAGWDGGVTQGKVPAVHGKTGVYTQFLGEDGVPDSSQAEDAGSIWDRDGGTTLISCPTPGRWAVFFRMTGADGVTVGQFSDPSEVTVVALVDTEGIKAALEDARARQDAAQAELDAAVARVGGLESDWNDADLPALRQALADAQAAVSAAEGRLDATEGRVATAETGLEDLRDTRLPALEESLSMGLVDANEWRVDGWIEARHIISESVAAAVAEFLELNADQITAGTIDAERLNVADLAARIATVVQLNADRITTGKLAAERVDIADLFADTAFIAELRAGVVEAIQVTAERIITGDIVATGTLDVSHINVTEELTAEIGQFLTIEADQIAANALDAMVITAPVLQSHAQSATGWKIRPGTGLEMWNPSGSRTIRLDGVNNSIQGRISTAEGELGRVAFDRFPGSAIFPGSTESRVYAGMGFESDVHSSITGVWARETDGRITLSSGTGGDSTGGRPYGFLTGGWDVHWLRPSSRLETFDSCIVGRPVTPALTNNYRGAPSGEQDPSYTRLGDWVMLSGGIRKPEPTATSNWSGTIMFVPAPAFPRRMASTISGATGVNPAIPLVILIDTSGRLSVVGGVNQDVNWTLSLDGLVYKL